MLQNKQIEDEKTDIEENENKYKWTSFHTLAIVCLRLCSDVIFMTPLIFDDKLAEESLSTLSTFSSVNMMQYFGTIVAMFIAPFNTRFFKNSNKTITVTYAILSGILTILFGCTYGIKWFYPMQYMLIIPQCIIWFFYGSTWIIFRAATVALATQYSDHAHHGAIVSLISFSWSIASLFYVVVAYLITVHPSLPFIVFGVLSILCAVLVHYTCNFQQNDESQQSEESLNNSEGVNMRQIIDVFTHKQYRLLILISTILGISSGANKTVLGSPVFDDLYGLNAHIIGWCLGATYFLGEFSSNLFMVKYSDKLGYYVTALIGLILKISAAIFIIFVSIYHDSDLFSLTMTLFMVFLVQFAWEVFFVTQLTAINKTVEANELNQTGRSQKRVVFICHYVSVSFIKPIGIWMAAHIWNDGDGLIWIGFLLLITSLSGSVLYCVFFKNNRQLQSHDV
eukprot:245275_1